MRRITRTLFTLAALTGLLASAAVAAEGQPPDGRWLPADVGNRWSYVYARERLRTTAAGDEETDVLKGSLVNQVTGTAEAFAPGSVEIQSVLRGHTNGATAETVERSRNVVQSAGAGHRLLAREAAHPISGEVQMRRFDPPLEVIATELKTGERWQLGVDQVDAVRTEYEAEILGVQTARTPAGVYEKCLVVRTTGNRTGRVELFGTSIEVESGRVTSTKWYAPGVGVVLSKEEVEQTLRLADGTTLGIQEKTQYALSAVELAKTAAVPDPAPAAPDAAGSPWVSDPALESQPKEAPEPQTGAGSPWLPSPEAEPTPGPPSETPAEAEPVEVPSPAP